MRELAFRIPVQISASPGATSPDPGAAGVIAWSMTSSTLVTWDGAQWVLADLGPQITVSSSAPSAPALNQLWLEI